MRRSASKVIRIFVVGAVAICGAGCMGPHPLDDDPLLILLQQQAAWNSGDIIGFMAGYHRAEDTTFASSDGILGGWDTVLARYRKRYPDTAAMGTLTFSDLTPRSLGRDAVLVTGKWQLKREKDEPGGVFSVILMRFDGDWRIVHDHTSAFAK